MPKKEITDYVIYKIICNDENIINDDTFSITNQKINECLALLNGYINFLVKQKSTN